MIIRKKKHFLLACALFFALSLPNQATNRIRSTAVGLTTSSWRHLTNLKEVFLKATTIWPSGGYHIPPQLIKEMEMLRLENHQLKSQTELLKAQLDLEKLSQRTISEDMEQDLKRKQEFLRQLELYAHAMTARVIFRESTAWKSSMWINVGEETNRRLHTRLIEKNSPVVLGTTVVGVIDYVEERRSRVRLISDHALNPSVRALREIDRKTSLYLAKGITQGIRSPLYRTRGTTLRGVGFNYDFHDDEGPNRDLRSGKTSSSQENMPLVAVGDLIVTMGIDGIFPAGLKIGYISKVYPLREGSCSYEVDIQSLVKNFDALSFVTVLPSLATY